jgi:cardiolipin synthase
MDWTLKVNLVNGMADRRPEREAWPFDKLNAGKKVFARLVRCSAILLFACVLAGCATSGTRSRYLEQIAPDSITNLAAYYAGSELEIHYPLHGKNTFAHATWTQPRNGATNFQNQFAILTMGKEKRAVRRAVVNPGNRLVIRDVRQWKQLLNAVFAGLVPNKPDHGVLLLVQNMEIIVYRNAAGILKVVNLADKPPWVIVDKTFSDDDFSREAIRLLQANASALDRNQEKFLFLTGADPTFVLIEPRQRLVIFLGYPADPEAGPIAVPGWFAVRTLNSLLIKSLVITAIKNPFSLIGRGLWHLGNSGMTILDAVPSVPTVPPPPLYTGPGMNLAAWEKELDGLVSARRYKGRADFFIDGSQFFPVLIQSIENSRHSVDVMVYIFGTDYYATRIADILKERSSSVRVRVLMDDIGTLFSGGVPESAAQPDFQPPTDIQSYLEAGSHIHVRLSADPWLATDHRKCIIIDRQRAFVGGMNIGSVYRYEWHDLMTGLTGPIVGRLDKEYRKAWIFAGPLGDFGYAWASLFDRERPRKHTVTGGIDLRPLRTATGELQIYHAQLAAIRRARGYIYIENSYFNDDTILRALIAARQRGVDVRVILPAQNDVGIMQTSNFVMANEMIRHGIRVYIYPGMTHVKAAIYDGWACTGSANLEKMSLRISQELDIAFSDPATVDRLKQDLFEADFKRAEEMKSPVALDWLDPLVKAFADQL